MNISLEIENHYELYENVTTTVTVDVPTPPADASEFDDWLQDHIYPLTGTGHEDGNSAYFVTVTACDDPRWLHQEWEFGL